MPQAIGMVLDRIEAQQANALQLRPDAMSIDLLRAVYRSPSIPLPVRMRAAIAALPHETPKLGVTVMVNDQDFATLLDARIKRMEAMNGKPQPHQRIIEAKPQVDVRPPLATTNDRRFRRM
jgi:hypothetical protein